MLSAILVLFFIAGFMHFLFQYLKSLVRPGVELCNHVFGPFFFHLVDAADGVDAPVDSSVERRKPGL